MGLLWILFGLGGRIGRAQFAFGLVGAVAAFALVVWGAQAAMPWLEAPLAEQGVNANQAINMLWSAMTLLLAWVLLAMCVKRLRDRGLSVWWAVVVVLPLAALELANNTLVLAAMSEWLPRQVQWPLTIASCLFGLWVLTEGLLGPEREAAVAKPVSPEPGARRRDEKASRFRLPRISRNPKPAGDKPADVRDAGGQKPEKK